MQQPCAGELLAVVEVAAGHLVVELRLALAIGLAVDDFLPAVALLDGPLQAAPEQGDGGAEQVTREALGGPVLGVLLRLGDEHAHVHHVCRADAHLGSPAELSALAGALRGPYLLPVLLKAGGVQLRQPEQIPQARRPGQTHQHAQAFLPAESLRHQIGVAGLVVP